MLIVLLLFFYIGLLASTNVDANSNLVDTNNFSAYDLIPASVLASTLESTLILIFWYNY
jgi:hypothetical protein